MYSTRVIFIVSNIKLHSWIAALHYEYESERWILLHQKVLCDSPRCDRFSWNPLLLNNMLSRRSDAQLGTYCNNQRPTVVSEGTCMCFWRGTICLKCIFRFSRQLASIGPVVIKVKVLSGHSSDTSLINVTLLFRVSDVLPKKRN